MPTLSEAVLSRVRYWSQPLPQWVGQARRENLPDQVCSTTAKRTPAIIPTVQMGVTT
jgi:hypothetical protein